VKEISLSSFAAGHAVGVIAGVPQKFDAREVVRRARSRLGEDRYRLLTNNCERFFEWCLQGARRSYRIEACLDLHSRALLATERLMISIGECVSAFGKGFLKRGMR
jgi:hypothetical protein